MKGLSMTIVILVLFGLVGFSVSDESRNKVEYSKKYRYNENGVRVLR